jgi:hypothetical protein
LKSTLNSASFDTHKPYNVKKSYYEEKKCGLSS